MKKHFYSKIRFVFILVLLIVFLFLNTYSYATANPFNSAFDDDELEAQYPGASTSDCTFHLTWFGGDTLGSGLTASDFEYNETMGWYEYEYNGKNYVVLAAATRYLIGSSWSYASYIRYFRYGEIIQFKLNGSIYDGMILDSCGASMNVSEGNSQILDVYTCVSESSYSGAMTQNSGTEVDVSDNGNWSTSAGTSSSYGLGEFILKCFAKIFSVIGDFIQKLIDRTGTDSTSYGSLTYSMNTIQANSELNDDINVVAGNDLSADDEDPDDGIVKEATISADWGTTSTEIPVIPIEIYSCSLEKVQLFDIDFLSDSNTNSNGFWKSVSYVVNFMTRIFSYIAAIALITLIIWRAVLIALASIRDDPNGAEKSKEIINNIFKTILFMVGVYVIIFLMIYLYKYILSIIIDDNDTSYIIRLYVKNAYTFNTNFTGYLRYRAMSDNAAASFAYSLLYMIIAIVNAIYFIMMVLRMIILALLTIIAPITSLSAMKEDKVQVGFSLKNMFNFNVWIKLYTWFTWWPMIVVILMRAFISIS